MKRKERKDSFHHHSPILDATIDTLNKRRKREESLEENRAKYVLGRSNSDDRTKKNPFASEFDEMWNDDVGDETINHTVHVEMKDVQGLVENKSISSLRSCLRKHENSFVTHHGGREAPPPTPDHVLMPPPLMRAKLRKNGIFSSITPEFIESTSSGGLRGRSLSPTPRAPPPSPQAYNTKVAFIRPSMPPSPILRSPLYSPLHPSLEDCPAKAMYSMTGTSPQFGPRQSSRSPPPLPLQGSASPATFLSQKMNAHHLTHRAVRQSTTAVLQRVAANMTVMKAAVDIQVSKKRIDRVEDNPLREQQPQQNVSSSLDVMDED